MKVVFFGSPGFAVPIFEALLASPHPVVGVVTQPDRPRDRGQKLTEGPVKTVALSHAIPVLQPERLRDPVFLHALAAFGADLGVVAAYGKILPESVLAIPRLGLMNVHASLLPRYRGAAPIQRAVMAGETRTGIAIMRVVRELDAGPILTTAATDIDPDETSVQVAVRLAGMGASLLLRVIDDLGRGIAVETPQDDRLATYAPRLVKGDGAIRWDAPARVVHNQVRGLVPWPHAFTTISGQRCLVLQTAIVESGGGPARADGGAGEPGVVIEASGPSLCVSAGGGTALRILRIQPEGRRPMSAREFLAGHPLSPGTRLGSR